MFAKKRQARILGEGRCLWHTISAHPPRGGPCARAAGQEKKNIPKWEMAHTEGEGENRPRAAARSAFPGYEFAPYVSKNAHDILGATYVLTMRDSTRNYRKQLDRFTPALTNYVVKNDGYKNVDRPLCKQAPVYDAVYSYAQIFKHAAIHHPHVPILLLEDDFFWKSDADDLPSLLRDIRIFIDGHAGVDHYWLGCLPLPMLRIPQKVGDHVRIHGRALASHAVISTPKAMRFFIETMQHFPCKIEFADPFMSETRVCYRHKRQLCYQLFEDSPSQRMSWPKYLSAVTRALRLHKRPEPVWTCTYRLVEYHVQFLLAVGACVVVAALRKPGGLK